MIGAFLQVQMFHDTNFFKILLDTYFVLGSILNILYLLSYFIIQLI